MYRHLSRWWPAYALAALAVYPWILRAPYFHVLGFDVLLFATMATSWNIIGGYTGYKSLGHGAFFGLGAYFVALAAQHLGWNPLWSAPLLALVVLLVALGLGWIMLRATGAAFAIATIALVLIFRLLALNLRDITNGATGLSLPLPPWPPAFSRMPFFYYMLVWLAITLVVSHYIRHSRFGLGLLAIRDDEHKAAMVGVDTTLYKVLAFGISAYFVAVGGGIWAYHTTHITPIFAFDILVGLNMILMAMLGGMGTLWGPALGAFILTPIAEVILFFFGSTEIHLTLFGLLMLSIILFLPRGMLPSITEWWQRRSAGSAFAGARSAAELHAGQAAPRDEAAPVSMSYAPGREE